MPKTTTYRTIAGLNKALRKLPKEATVRLRDASVEIAADVAKKARTRALSVGGVAKLVAPTIRATRDKVPVVKVGSAKRLPPHNGKRRTGPRQTVADVTMGAEFGGGKRPRTAQFMPVKRPGYFLYATVEDEADNIMESYSEALLDAMKAIK